MWDTETQRALKLSDIKDIGSAIVYALKIQATQQSSHRDRYSIRAASFTDSNSYVMKLIEDLKSEVCSFRQKGMIEMWKFNVCTERKIDKSVGIVRNVKMVEISSQNNGTTEGKLIRDYLEGRRCPGKMKFRPKFFKIPSSSKRNNRFFVVRHINKIPCNLIIDAGANITIIRKELWALIFFSVKSFSCNYENDEKNKHDFQFHINFLTFKITRLLL